MKKIIALLLALLMLASFAACTKKADTANSGSAPNGSTDKSSDNTKLPDIVTGSIVFKDYGTVTFEPLP